MIHLNGHTLTAPLLARIAAGEGVTLDEGALALVAENRAVVDRIVAEGRTVYGINTGFGQFATVVIAPDQLQLLQLNLIRSHAAGVGEPLPKNQTRALMAARINCLLKAHSGIRPEPIRLLTECLNRDVVPVVPSQGSVGASGDLAPLAHMALLLVGEGLAWFGEKHVSGGDALAQAGLQPVTLQAKEGLALINGTQLITSLGNLAVEKFTRLAGLADEIAALSLEALRGTRAAFDPRIHAARPHPGQIAVARNMREILGATSAIADSHQDCHRVQDAYSLRCIPQVHGVTRDALQFAGAILERELNSATDNPMIFTDTQESRSGGNFHGQYPAFACDVLAIAAADLASISERRQERLVNPAYSDLPAFLTQNGGLESGFMMAHVTSAALVSEMKGLAHPACVDTIPTSAGKEDHVSMGPIAARKLLRAVDALEQVLAIEARMALEGVRILGLAPAAGLQPLMDRLSEACAPWSDRVMFEEINKTLGALCAYEEARP
ncbi:MAG: histidine ammonia-lyase [Holophagaceae bacterium]|jgi:histidine ammonia-lyase|uniref:Histidine ammonia-lyase n=1 Tax=Candidatus Geothrix odensensis TaxID=2954440 RepID=A0A936F238_9BACT|nr:histidine ammonia-lyase [Candidatus Geothrix odensensis]MBK8788853.1 histidine ammonia-lyase [Holophagaceae bacterium]